MRTSYLRLRDVVDQCAALLTRRLVTLPRLLMQQKQETLGQGAEGSYCQPQTCAWLALVFFQRECAHSLTSKHRPPPLQCFFVYAASCFNSFRTASQPARLSNLVTFGE